MSKTAKWVKFHPGSSCSVGDTEENMSDERFNELFASEHVVEASKKADDGVADKAAKESVEKAQK
jgi:hypothetical protein